MVLFHLVLILIIICLDKVVNLVYNEKQFGEKLKRKPNFLFSFLKCLWLNKKTDFCFRS